MVSLGKVDAQAQKTAKDAGLKGKLGNITQTCPCVQLEIGVFFDGTLNNRYNVEIGRDLEQLDPSMQGSYKNALSNPALLWEIYKQGPKYDELGDSGDVTRKFDRIYIQGAGSDQGKPDDRIGYVFGKGPTGVEARVVEAFEKTLSALNKSGGAPNVEKLVLDVFGFSRGAAAARYFVNAIRQRNVLYQPLGGVPIRVSLPQRRELDVEIRFVGIFDTVAAIGVATNSLNFPVNVHLDEKKQVTEKIYHITAGDEYRTNFRLNKNTPDGGATHELPGAHSDIGGGYRYPGDTAPIGNEEIRSFSTRQAAEMERQKANAKDLSPGVNALDEAVFIEEGWMTGHETEGGIIRGMSEIVAVTRTEKTHPGPHTPTTIYQYSEKKVLYRPWVQIGLSRVALHMMYEKAIQYVDGAMLELPIGVDEYTIPDGLIGLVPAMKAGILTDAQKRYILRNYGHVSMKSGTPVALSGIDTAAPVVNEDWWGHRPSVGHIRVEYDNKPGLAV